MVSLVIFVISNFDVTPLTSFTLKLTSLMYQPFSPSVPSITNVPVVGLSLFTFNVYFLVALFPALSTVVTITSVPVVLAVILLILLVVLACPLVVSLPLLTLSVRDDIYHSPNPFVPSTTSVPGTGGVLSTFTVYSFVALFPALSTVVTTTFVPLVSLVILLILLVVLPCPLVVSLPSLTLNVTLLLYQPLSPNVPFITNSPTVGAVLSTFTV